MVVLAMPSSPSTSSAASIRRARRSERRSSALTPRYGRATPDILTAILTAPFADVQGRVRGVVTVDEARALALSLPEAVEQDHHGKPSFRVGGKIFATLWGAEDKNEMLDAPGGLTADARRPGT